MIPTEDVNGVVYYTICDEQDFWGEAYVIC